MLRLGVEALGVVALGVPGTEEAGDGTEAMNATKGLDTIVHHHVPIFTG